jgi:tRNA threonylcarbamoyladenosine biosynthesis protein TsaB
MLTLAIETSGMSGSIALLQEDSVLSEKRMELGRRHAQMLVPEIKSLLDGQGKEPIDVGLVAVSIGPGSFTGLRSGIVCAKVFAYVTNCAIVGVDTMQATACMAPLEFSQVSVGCDAQRGEMFVRAFTRDALHLFQPAGALEIVPAAKWRCAMPGDTAMTGPGLERLPGDALDSCHVVPKKFWHPTAAAVGQLGIAAYRNGLRSDCWSLEPLYVRRSSAEDQWDARLPPNCPSRPGRSCLG